MAIHDMGNIGKICEVARSNKYAYAQQMLIGLNSPKESGPFVPKAVIVSLAAVSRYFPMRYCNRRLSVPIIRNAHGM